MIIHILFFYQAEVRFTTRFWLESESFESTDSSFCFQSFSNLLSPSWLWALITALKLNYTRPACCPPHSYPQQTSWTVPPRISSCKCQCPHTSGSFFLNIKQNNDDLLVYVSLLREFSEMAISFIMSHVCFCCACCCKNSVCFWRTEKRGFNWLIYF